jgi:Tfp pilus assembly protein PilE
MKFKQIIFIGKNLSRVNMKINYKKGFTQVVDFGLVFQNVSKNLRGLVGKIMSGSVLKSHKTKTFSKPKFTTGFSIVEIVVIVGIMAILTTLVYTSLDSSKKQSRDQKKVAEISSVKLALEQFYSRNKFYPHYLGHNGLKQFLAEVPDSVTYAPLKTDSSASDTQCSSYHLWTTLESKISVLDDKKGFNSTGKTKCGTYSDSLLINASSTPLIYDVIPN